MIKPSQVVSFYFGVQTPSTGAAVNADSTPTVVIYKNGAVDVAVTPTVTNPATGNYKVAFTVPSGYVAGDLVEALATATVAAVASPPTSVFLDSVDTVRESDTYARIGANGAGLTALGDARLANLDASVASRMATFIYTAPDNATITAIAGFLDTEIAAILVAAGAIKTKTDFLPADTAAVLALLATQAKLLSYVRSLARSDFAEDSDIAGTYDAAADSLEAQANAGGGAAPTAAQNAAAVWADSDTYPAGSKADDLANLVPGSPIEETIEITETHITSN